MVTDNFLHRLQIPNFQQASSNRLPLAPQIVRVCVCVCVCVCV